VKEKLDDWEEGRKRKTGIIKIGTNIATSGSYQDLRFHRKRRGDPTKKADVNPRRGVNGWGC